jgi:hypothetical protein
LELPFSLVLLFSLELPFSLVLLFSLELPSSLVLLFSLALVSSLVDFAGNSNTLTDFERAILEQSLRDVEAGNVIPHDVAMKQAAQWLKESSK